MSNSSNIINEEQQHQKNNKSIFDTLFGNNKSKNNTSPYNSCPKNCASDFMFSSV